MIATLVAGEADPGPQAARSAVDALHRELAGRFRDAHGLLLDYTAADGSVAIPTAEECREAKPNGLAWWCPIENGAFFTGLWLVALVDRWEAEPDPATAALARQAAAGLLRLSTVGSTPGFIARGIAADGAGHHPAGSDDQTLPWFLGLYRYVRSGIPDQAGRAETVAAMLRVGSALRDRGWTLPCDPPELGFRGSFAPVTPITAPRLLFLVRALAEVGGDPAWRTLYLRLRDERPAAVGRTRLEVCADGDLIGEHADQRWNFYMLWTKGHSAACLALLAQLEDDPRAAAAYRAGLARIAAFAAQRTAPSDGQGWDAGALPAFDADWRRLLASWRPQRSVAEMGALANAQMRDWDAMSPRKNYELNRLAEPLFACWITTLSGDDDLIRASAPAIRAALCRYRWADVRYSWCFAGELAWWQGRRLLAADQSPRR